MFEEADRRVLAAALQVVENQLRDGTPPETRKTLERLVEEGRTAAEAKRLIATVILREMVDILRSNTPFDPAHFAAALDRLPALPTDGDE
jgi:hypothetical protein